MPKQILLSTILVIVINFVGLLYGTNYELTGAYKGFMVTSHSMASTMILSIANLTLYKKNSFHVVSVTLLTLFLFASQARTFMLPLAVILYFELRQWITHKTKRRAVIAIMAAVVIMIFHILVWLINLWKRLIIHMRGIGYRDSRIFDQHFGKVILIDSLQKTGI